MAKYGMSQVRNSPRACNRSFSDDAIEFVLEHPGGVGVIMKRAGQDATAAYDEIHDPSLVMETLQPEKCLGTVDPATLPHRAEAPESASSDETENVQNFPPLTSMVGVDDFEKVAAKYLSPAGWAYYASGADDELSIADSRRVFRKIAIRPRVLRHVEPVSPKTLILGFESSLPIYITPTGQGKYAYAESNSEAVIATAAGREDVIYCMPTSAVPDIVFAARVRPDQPLFFQLYFNRDRERARALIQKVEALGANAIFLTVDTPVLGKRERDDRLRAADGDDTLLVGGFAKTSSMGMLNPLLSWDDLAWIREVTKLPLVLKGIQTVEDAVLAHQYGADGIVLSNHGGRSQDTAQAPIMTLLEIRRYAPHLLETPIKDKFQVFVDGGFRRGTDVIKALALGATAVGIGRPALYSMCAGYGEKGLRRMINIFRAEIETNMALAGACSVDELVPEMVNSERAEKEVSRRVKL